MPVTIICKCCDKILIVPPSTAKTKKYCSQRCHGIDQGSKALIKAREVKTKYGLGPKKNLVGMIFFNWEVIDYSHWRHGPGSTHFWRTRCINCGIESIRPTSGLKHRGGCANCTLLPRGQAGLNEFYANYVRNSSTNGRKFDLTKDYFREITSKPCYYCGSPPSMVQPKQDTTSQWGKYTCNGIDRFDNSIGYVIGNCVPCCSVCNFLKRKLNGDKFIISVLKIASHLKTLGY